MQGRDEKITRLLMDRIGQNHSRTIRLSPKGAEEFGVMNRDHMQSFFASCVKPHGHFRIGKTDAVGHEQEQAVGG